tara:strand:+ start:383 stop:619 length:237 start_codon:yes stop_codon:yes gene_type:complete
MSLEVVAHEVINIVEHKKNSSLFFIIAFILLITLFSLCLKKRKDAINLICSLFINFIDIGGAFANSLTVWIPSQDFND